MAAERGACRRVRLIRHPSALSVRAKVLGTVLVLAALGLVVAGSVVFVVESRRLDARLSSAIRQELSEFRRLATLGRDPQTGDRFAGVEQLLALALERNVPDDNEAFLALVDGRPKLAREDLRTLHLEEEPAVLEVVRELARDAPVEIVEVPSSVGTLRLAAVQVSVERSPTVGTYVVAYAVDRERDTLEETARTYAVVALVSLLVLGAVGFLVTGRLLRPLRLLRDAAQRTAATELTDRIPVRGGDDVSDLTRSFNAMLDRLQESFAEQRQFLDDAGHELRTPVTILRGHLELLDPRDADEVADTRALLIDEVDRMSRLVEDLILLAKARRPDFVVAAPVDVARLTDEVVDKAVALGDRHWVVDNRAEVVVRADGQRLTQALLQLADNAVKHTGPGTTVGIGSAVRGDEVLLWVRDDGPGVAPQDAERVFERFGRASTGRGVDGSGLGLAIVRAIAEAHGGRVELSGGSPGATFTLVLPREAVA